MGLHPFTEAEGRTRNTMVGPGLLHTHTLRYVYATLPYVRCPALVLRLLETITFSIPVHNHPVFTQYCTTPHPASHHI